MFRELQADHLAYAKEHKEKANGSKSKLTVEIVLSCEDYKSQFFGIKTQLKASRPSPPAKVTKAIGSTTQTDSQCLFVRKTGTTYDTPEQNVMSDNEGNSIS